MTAHHYRLRRTFSALGRIILMAGILIEYPTIARAEAQSPANFQDQESVTDAQEFPPNNSQPTKPIEETIVVKGQRNSGYVAEKSTTGTKTDTPIHQVPASIQVITEQLIQDQGVSQSINTLLLNISGISANYGGATGNLPVVSMRGFDTGGFVLLDGFPQGGGSTYDWSNIEKVEVLKGPASVLYGSQHNVGGKINLITKKPTSTKNAQIGMAAGSWDFYRTWMDFSGDINNSSTLQYRFDAAVDTTHSYRDMIYDKNKYVAPSILWKFSAQDSLLLMADNKQRNYRADPGLPTHFWNDQAFGVSCCLDFPTLSRTRRGLDLPINLYLGTDFDGLSDTTQHLRGEWEHTFDKNWQVKIASAHTRMKYRGQGSSFWWASVLAEDGSLVLDNAGNGRSMLNLGGYLYRQKSLARSTSVDFLGPVTTVGLVHSLLVGVSVDDEIWKLPAGGIANYFTEDPVHQDDWLHPNHYHFLRDPNSTQAYAWRNQKDEGVYIQDMVEINEYWKILAGYRQGKTEGMWSWNPNDGTSPNNSGKAKTQGGMPRLGVVYEPSATLALYSGWSRSFNPNWGALKDGSLMPPVKGQQMEVGVKQDIAGGKANLNVAIYTIKKTDISACAPDSPDCTWYILLGGQKSRGIEFDLNGAVTPNLRLTNAITLQDAEVSSDMIFWGGAKVPKGQDMYAVPPWLYNLYATYSFANTLTGWELGGGFNAAGRTQANLPNDGLTIAGSRTLNLMLGYDLNASLHLQFNINNVMDKVNYSSSGWNLNFATTPRQYQLAITIKL